MPRSLTDTQFARLLEFRVALRRFHHWSERRAEEAGLTSAQHQLLVAVRGHPEAAGPTISNLAGYLFVRHHSAIGLLQRVEALGLVRRHADDVDQRVVRVRLTPEGAARVEALTAAHLAELRRLTPFLEALEDVASG
jgi:DNA-binding MarR family transcriptional regulator